MGPLIPIAGGALTLVGSKVAPFIASKGAAVGAAVGSAATLAVDGVVDAVTSFFSVDDADGYFSDSSGSVFLGPIDLETAARIRDGILSKLDDMTDEQVAEANKYLASIVKKSGNRLIFTIDGKDFSISKPNALVKSLSNLPLSKSNIKDILEQHINKDSITTNIPQILLSVFQSFVIKGVYGIDDKKALELISKGKQSESARLPVVASVVSTPTESLDTATGLSQVSDISVDDVILASKRIKRLMRLINPSMSLDEFEELLSFIRSGESLSAAYLVHQVKGSL